MKKITIILMALIALTMTANAQWALQTNPLTGNNSLGKIQFVSATEGWIACGSNGSLLHTTNAGANWNIVTPFPGDSVGNMSDPATTMNWANPMHGWALKTFGTFTDNFDNENGAVLYKTIDGGSTWSRNIFPKSVVTANYSTADLHGTWQMHELVAANKTSYSSDSWAGWLHSTLTLDANGNGTFPGMTKSSDITDYPSSVSLSLTSNGILSVGGDTHGFMSTDKNTVYMTTTDGGGGYGLGVMQRVASGVTYTTSDLQGTWQIHQLVTAHPASSNQYAGWIYGTIAIDSNGNGIASFIKPDGSKSQNIAVSISSDGTVLMNGTDFHGFMSADKKSICITMTDGGGYGYYLMAMQKVNPATSYATTDLQGKWQTHKLTTNSTSIISLFNQSGWSHGTITLNANGEGNTNFINSNNNNSNNNNSNNNQSGDNISLSISSDGLVTTSGKDIHGFMSADKSSILITMTEDNGGYTPAVMQKDLSTSGDVGLQVQFADENNGWASIYNMIYGNFQLYKTTDGGNTWNPTNSNAGGFFQFMDASNGWMIGTTIANVGEGNLNNIYHTTDGGATWLLQATNIGKANALYFSDLTHGWVVGESGLVLKTTDGGTNWTTVNNTGQTSNSNSKCVFFLDANNGWIGSGSVNNEGIGTRFILVTKDGGASWTTQSTPVTNDIFSLSFWDANNGWLTSDHGQIAAYTYTPPKTVNITAGGLYAALTSIELNAVTDLNISGQIDARDFRTMRDLMPLLANIDIRGVSIAEYTGTEGPSGSTSVKYLADNLPPNSFNNPTTFEGKQSLKSIILPTYLWAIGGAAFTNSTLEKVVMPSTVYDIQSWSFSGSKIDSMYIPASVTIIGSSAFGGTNKLPSIGVSADNQHFTSVDGVLFDKLVTKLLAFPSAKCQYYTIPTGVTSIEANAFQASDILEELTIPTTVTKIGNSAFIWSWGLKKINIPSSVTTIEANAFNSCGNLSKIYVESSTPVDLSSSADVFLNVDRSSCILYVPVGYKAAYQAANQWRDFQNIVETGGSVTYNVTVPVGTKACYIAGEMNSWIQQIMTKVDDTHYKITIENADISQKYKYCSGPAWSYNEQDASGNINANRSYSTNDIVASWSHVYDPANPPSNTTFMVTVPVGTNDCYIVGDMNIWSFTSKMDKIDATHFTITLQSSPDFIYKYCCGPSWDYVEVNADGSDFVKDRTFAASDVVVKWKAVPTGINTIDADKLTLYPNPATDGFYIEADEKAATVSICDLNGRTLLTKQIATGKEFVSISTLPQGIYMVKIASENRVTVKKLLKK